MGPVVESTKDSLTKSTGRVPTFSSVMRIFDLRSSRAGGLARSVLV